MSKPIEHVRAETELFCQLFVRHEFGQLVQAPVEPVSARSKARLLETLRRHGISDTSTVEALPVKEDTILAQFLDGTVETVRLAADYARRLIGSLLDPAAFAVPTAVPSMRQREETEPSRDTKKQLPSLSSALEPPGGEAHWTLKSINRDPQSEDVELVLAKEVTDVMSKAVRVLAWTHDAVDRVRSAADELTLTKGDVHLLAERPIDSDEERIVVTVTLPAGFRLSASSSAPVHVPLDSNGVLQVVLKIVSVAGPEARQG